jgi:hypothetical protein
VRENAKKYLEELKTDKDQKDYMKNLEADRKSALEEGNRKIREANLRRFNMTQKSGTSFAWGVDQRKVKSNNLA